MSIPDDPSLPEEAQMPKIPQEEGKETEDRATRCATKLTFWNR